MKQTLDNCPAGLFLVDGFLFLKTNKDDEMTNQAYTLGEGEDEDKINYSVFDLAGNFILFDQNFEFHRNEMVIPLCDEALDCIESVTLLATLYGQ